MRISTPTYPPFPSFPRGLKFKKYISYQLIGIYVLL